MHRRHTLTVGGQLTPPSTHDSPGKHGGSPAIPKSVGPPEPPRPGKPPPLPLLVPPLAPALDVPPSRSRPPEPVRPPRAPPPDSPEAPPKLGPAASSRLKVSRLQLTPPSSTKSPPRSAKPRTSARAEAAGCRVITHHHTTPNRVFEASRLLNLGFGTIFTKVSGSPRSLPESKLRIVASAPASNGASDGAAAREPSDEELIAAVQRGDHQVASVIYERLGGVVDHTLYRVFGRRETDHDDLVQAAFEQIVVTLSRRSYARACSLRTWASSIASHVGFNALRSRRRERRVLDREAGLDAEPARSGIDVEGEASARAELERLRTQLSEMKSTHAEAVFLHDVLGHELAEIALMTQVSVSAAQSRLVRGRRELFRRLDRTSPRGKAEVES